MKEQPERLSWYLGKVRGYYKRNYDIEIPLLGIYLKKKKKSTNLKKYRLPVADTQPLFTGAE